MAFDPMAWYLGIPLVSRFYLTFSFLTTAACALDLVSPFALYFNWKLVARGEVWRLVSNFFFFGLFNLDFLFHMYFLLRYCRELEESPEFRGRTADFVTLIIFGAVLMSLIAPYTKVQFLGSSLTFMMVHVWGQMRSNSHQRMMLLQIIPFTAPYLPWVLLSFSLLLGHSAMVDVIGIAVGHAYLYLKFVLPEIAQIRGWRVQTFLPTLGILHYIFATPDALRLNVGDGRGGVQLEEFVLNGGDAAAVDAELERRRRAPEGEVAAVAAGGAEAAGAADAAEAAAAAESEEAAREAPGALPRAEPSATRAQQLPVPPPAVSSAAPPAPKAAAVPAAPPAAPTAPTAPAGGSDPLPPDRTQLRNRRLQALAARAERARAGGE